eukprot:TRINITY_DN32348_c0_g1_i1.p1 TRINITY_DN32348_c0_g1~~TRINITY_DN32348_c0_g1_i1.p1  ORF type:complete len:678 (-),score=101.68 TRINITY_DN32348_c0_g1_i1:56-2089(-)
MIAPMTSVASSRLSAVSTESVGNDVVDVLAKRREERRQTTKEKAAAAAAAAAVAVSAADSVSPGHSDASPGLSPVREMLIGMTKMERKILEEINRVLHEFKEELKQDIIFQASVAPTKNGLGQAVFESDMLSQDTGPPAPPTTLRTASLIKNHVSDRQRPEPLCFDDGPASKGPDSPSNDSLGSDLAWSVGSPVSRISPSQSGRSVTSNRSNDGLTSPNSSPLSVKKFKHKMFEQAHIERLSRESQGEQGSPRETSSPEPETEALPTNAVAGAGGLLRKGSSLSLASSGSLAGNIALASQAVRKNMRRTRSRSRCQLSIWTFFEDPDFFTFGRAYVRAMALAILFSAALPLMQAMEPPPLDAVVRGLCEVILDCLFTLELGIRFFACPNFCSFLVNPYNAIDAVVALVPLFLRITLGITISVAEARTESNFILTLLLAQMPVLRMLKLLRRFEAFHLILKAFRVALEALPVLLYNLTILLLLFGTTLYIVEPNVQTMGDAMWLTIVTVGTVGYGDVVPSSAAGVMVVSVLIVVSALYMAIPIGIVGQAFVEVWNDRDRLLLLHRTRIRFATNGYSAKDIPQMFISFDKDRDGELTLAEFTLMMRSLEIDFSKSRIEDLFNSFDADGSGALDDAEFVKAIFPWAYTEIYKSVGGDDSDAELHDVEREYEEEDMTEVKV